MAEDVDIKKIWSGYYSEMLNGTNRKSNYCTREKVKEHAVSPISVEEIRKQLAIR